MFLRLGLYDMLRRVLRARCTSAMSSTTCPVGTRHASTRSSHARRREFAPFVFSLVVSAALRLGILLVRLEWAFGIKPMPTWGAELASHVMGPLFVFERIAMLVFYMSAAEAIRKATSPQLYSRACLEARDASRQRVPEEDISF